MEPKRRRKRQPHRAQAAAITSLNDDVIAEILLHLPSLASVARAALTCARWRRLATSRDFLRRFRALHPSASLLGCFTSFANHEEVAFRAFHRTRICSDRDLAAAVRGGDFWLAGLEDEQQLRIRDCRRGVLLLASPDQFALFNPVSRRRINLSRPTGGSKYDNWVSFHSCFLPDSGGDGPSFRLVSLAGDDKNDLQAYVYSSDTGRVYWKYQKGEVLLSLDTSSMDFSHVALPPVPELFRPQALYVVGDTEDGVCCLVCVVRAPPDNRSHALQVWLRNEEAGSWELRKEVSFFQMLYACEGIDLAKVRRVCAVTAGVVLFCMDCASGRYRYMACRLKNMNAGLVYRHDNTAVAPEADFVTCRGLAAYPYLFTWPPDRLIQGGDAASD